MLTIRILGGLEVERDGVPVALPRSKRTRALLAYLAVTGKSHRRDYLCSLLWEIPDDPRGALRWSMSKLRPIVDDPDVPRIVANREEVSFDPAGAAIDLEVLRARVSAGIDAVTTSELQGLAETVRGTLLEGLDLPECHEFQAWLTAERGDARAMHGAVLSALVERLADRPDEALPYARSLVQVAPFDEAPWTALIRVLAGAGRRQEAEEQYQAAVRAMEEAGVEASSGLKAALRPVSQPGRDAAASAASQPAPAARTAGAGGLLALELPDKPSIAVLPFENLSGDAEQEYFADGLAEDVITALSRFRLFFVIARNTSFTYRGQSVEVKDVGRELGVQYVLEGSVRNRGKRMRVTAQLIDAEANHHIWAERYDRELEDIFAVEDEITQSIITSVAPEFLFAEAQRAQRKDFQSLGCWDLVMRARWHLTKFTRDDNVAAQDLLRRAIDAAPDNALAHSNLAFSHIYETLYGWGGSGAESVAKAAAAARRAVAIDDRDAWALAVLGRVDLLMGRHDESIFKLERAIELNPNDPYAYGQIGLTLGLAGELDRAFVQIHEAIRLSPRDPMKAVWLAELAIVSFYADRFEECADWSRQAMRENPKLAIPHRILTAALGQLDRPDEAKAALDGLMAMQPGLTVSRARDQIPPTKNPADKERYLDSLAKAGVPL